MPATVAVCSPDTSRLDTERAELLQIIKERSFRRGHFVLASGRQSEFYCNLKPTMMHPRGAHLSGRAFLEAVRREAVDYVGGLEMGAVPIIAALAALSDIERQPVKTFFVRKKAKDHGTRDLVEGLGPGDSLAGKRVLVADDVATTGGSILQAAEQARAAGAQVVAALVLVDREEGAAEHLAEHGLRLLSVFRVEEFA